MRIDDRVKMARLSYIRALGTARADSTPTAWSHLLTAAKNLEAAIRERDRTGPRYPVPASPDRA